MATPAWLREAAAVDFETLSIADRPDYPPVPVGVAISLPGSRPRYLAWGHRAGTNTATWAEARRSLWELYSSGRPLLFHNAKFDLCVAQQHLGLPLPPWQQVHDTLPLLFLRDPRAPDYHLKNSAERLLGQKPEERDAVTDWLLEQQPVPGIKISRSRDSKTTAGAFIAYAPAELVGKYACGDVARTRDLAAHVYNEVETRGMLAAYDRERELLPSLMVMEAQGISVDLKRLGHDIERYHHENTAVEEWLKRRLKAADDINLDSGPQLAAALIKAGLATEAGLGLTEKGNLQTNKAALTGAVTDPAVLAALKYRTQLATCLHTFMEPWYDVATRSGGKIFTTWHSTRTDRGSGGVGTRTGRLSSTPNFQNLAKTFAPLFAEWTLDPAEAKKLPKLPAALAQLRQLPQVRSYVVPSEKDHVLIDRDFNGQELRLLGHFDGDAILRAYQADPKLDLHGHAQGLINGMLGTNYSRKQIKNLAFCQLYGGGLGKIAEMIGTDVATAKRVKEAYMTAFPGLKAMYADMKVRAKAKQPIRTWGGREYFCEDPVFKDGRMMTFDFKLVNVLIQGSAADVTKEAMRRYCQVKPAHHQLLMTVHDELLASVPKAEHHQALAQMRQAMESIECDVKMLSDGAIGQNWAEMKPYKDKEAL